MKEDKLLEDEEIAKNFIDNYLNEPDTSVPEPEKLKDTTWHDLILNQMPLGKLYHPGYRFQFRAAEVGEIQHFSTIENDKAYDIRNKLNDILKTCLKVTLPNKKAGSYLDLKMGDRLYVIYLIRELTFQKGRSLSVPVKCSKRKCKTNFDIEISRQNFEYWEEEPETWKFFNPQYQAFVYETTLSDNPVIISMPTIGIQESFKRWMEDKKFKKEEINNAYVKIAPYLVNKNDMSVEELDQFKERFDEISSEEFMFLNDIVDRFKTNKFKVGIKGLMQKCPTCGQEVRTSTVFPIRASDLFIVPNAFEYYIKK